MNKYEKIRLVRTAGKFLMGLSIFLYTALGLLIVAFMFKESLGLMYWLICTQYIVCCHPIATLTAMLSCGIGSLLLYETPEVDDRRFAYSRVAALFLVMDVDEDYVRGIVEQAENDPFLTEWERKSAVKELLRAAKCSGIVLDDKPKIH